MKIVQRNLLPSDSIDGIYCFDLICQNNVFILPQYGISLVVEKGEDYLAINGKTYTLLTSLCYNIRTNEFILHKDKNKKSTVDAKSTIVGYSENCIRTKIKIIKKETSYNDKISYLQKQIEELQCNLQYKERVITALQKDLDEKNKLIEAIKDKLGM